MWRPSCGKLHLLSARSTWAYLTTRNLRCVTPGEATTTLAMALFSCIARWEVKHHDDLMLGPIEPKVPVFRQPQV